ncbi:MAG: metallophosphoesterase [Candidatus Bathyarchaeota archaeon]
MNEEIFQDSRLLGMISDTHDNIYMIDEAVKRLNNLGVELVLHAGDYISPFTVQYFKPLNAKLIGVYGNNCAERATLKKLFSDIGADLRGFFAEIALQDLKVALLHGHDQELLRSLIESKTYNLVIYGHTYQVSISQKGKTTVINPGEVCGYLSGKSTIVVYDLEKYNSRTIDLCE